MESDISIKTLEQTATEFCSFEDMVHYARLGNSTFEQLMLPMHDIIKIDGLVINLITKGSLTFTYNFEDYTATAPAIVLLPPGAMINIKTDDETDYESSLLSFKPSFLQEVNLSFSVISNNNFIGQKSPVLNIPERSAALLLRLYSLIWTAMSDQENILISKHILSSLASALLYEIMLLVYKSIDTSDARPGMGPGRRSYVRDFMKLVHLNFTRERSVNFYASKLFISPKYLSLLVKEATGKSAAYWIDQFVINEAKNLLRYSGKNIQQVGYALNFSNQSSFGKYFKHLTGMSPTEFQKS